MTTTVTEASIIREEKMVEEEQLFSIINVCCKNILQLMKDDDIVRYLASKKRRIDPSNYAEIISRCEDVLENDKLKMVHLMKKAIDSSVDIIVKRYLKWGLVIGESEGQKLGVDSIESKSSACMALYRAAFTYKPGNGFANYAPFWIKQIIQKSMDNRMLSTLDSSVSEEHSKETNKDRLPGPSSMEPELRFENNQVSEIYQRLANQLTPVERVEVDDWWIRDMEPTAFTKTFAHEMYSYMN